MKKSKKLSAYSIILIIMIILYIILLLFLPELDNNITKEMIKKDNMLVNGILKIPFSTFIMSPYEGFISAVQINIFVLLLGGFLSIVNSTEALNASINKLILRFKGREFLLIPILMTIFSIGGTTYGMAEDSLSLLPVIYLAMISIGFNDMVGVATLFLGAGVGVLGSTINPFSIGIAISTLNDVGIKNLDIEKIILLGLILLVTSLILSIIYVTKYAKKIQNINNKEYIQIEEKFTKKQKGTLILFSFTFIIMIIGLIPWGNYNINVFEYTSFLLGKPLGEWYFSQLSMWFLIMGIIIGIYNKYDEQEIISIFIEGSKSVLPVVFIISLSRGITVLMQNTYLDIYLLNILSNSLKNMPILLFTPLSYIIYIILSFLVPSTSGLATLSLPIMGTLTNNLGYSPEVMILIYSASCGLVNLITPTSAFIMGGLIIAKMDYLKYLKWVIKLIIMIGILNIIILTIAMEIL